MKKLLTLLMCGAMAMATAQEGEITLNGKELFGDMRARHIGPALMSGRIIDMEGHPTNGRILYAGTAGGGVWKSANGGASFQPIFDDYAQSIGKVKVDPKDPDNTIWVGTGEIWTRNSVSVGDGLYKTTDGGVNWKKMGFEKSERISSIEIHPENTNIMYVGVLGALWSDSDERGVYRSEDGGVTWEKTLYIDQTTGCADVIMDPNDPNILYASMWEFRRQAWGFNSGGDKSALYKSADGGKTWNKIHNGFPKGKLGRIAVAVAPSNSQILYAVLETEDETKRGLYRSDDAGSNWTLLNSDFGLVVRPFYFSRIVIDPRNPDVVVKGGLLGSISRDGGKTFKNMGNMHADIHDILFDLNDSDRMYVGTDGGVYRTWDGAATMEIVANMPVSQFYHISVDNAEPYNVYGGLQDNGSWYGPSSSPGGVEARDWNVVGYGDGFRVLPHPTKKILYSEMQGAQNVWRYDMDKQQTKTIQPLQVKGYDKLRFNWNAPMATSEAQPDRFYMGSQYLHISEDMGNTWKIISPDLTTNDKSKQNQAESGGLSMDNSGAENHCTIFTIAESPLNEKVIWVGTDDGNIQVTKDGGKTWTNTTANLSGVPANTWVYHIEASVHGEGTAYAVLEGHTSGDMNPYTYKTTDYGQTWTSIITDEVYGFVRNIQEDYENEDLLFLGTEFGLYVTINGGKNWNQFTNNMPPVAVHFIDLQKQTNDLVMGTHGRGIIIIDDISPLRQINQEVLAKDVHFFESKPMIMKETSPFGGTATEMEFVGANSSNNAQIRYYLKKKHIFGKMTMEIQDPSGVKLIELTPGKSKGINIVTWNGLIKQPKMAKGKTLAFGGFTSPRVPAGTYNVVMTKGKDTYTTTVTLKNDPNSILTDADRAQYYRTVAKLYDMSQELAYMVYEMDEILLKAEEVSKSGGNKVAEGVIKDLNALKETLVITTGDNYVASAEPQLRSKIGELYSKIASGFEPPSASELENLSLLDERFEKAKNDFSYIKSKKVPKMEKYMEGKGITNIQLKTFEEFIED
ncbi:WD40/YVTN/BNR-like repeat-containing protein [Ekhidna sp.]|uniref:WD40/YVTN/BNR-like repeat-containing protein n=1 Tax=Ekhidna sp. TaxID=2608089 RepID=UPI003512F733